MRTLCVHYDRNSKILSKKYEDFFFILDKSNKILYTNINPCLAKNNLGKNFGKTFMHFSKSFADLKVQFAS